MRKYLILFCIFISIVFSQHAIETREFRLNLDSKTDSINIMQLIEENTGTFKVELIELSNPYFYRNKQVLIQICELEFMLESKLSENLINYKLCKNKISSNGAILINSKYPEIILKNDKFRIIEGILVLHISGIFINSQKTIFNNANDGVLREWYDNGQLRLEYNMSNGVKDGICKRWYENGQIDILYNYAYGKLDGTQRKWHANGNIRAEWHYSKDVLHGTSFEYVEDGSMISKRTYDNGVLINEVNFN